VRATLGPALDLALFGVALWAVDHVLREYRYGDEARALADLPAWVIGAAVLLTCLGYLALVGYDWVAFRFARHPLPFRSMIEPSFVSFAVANVAPANLLTAGGGRFRLYERRGLTAGEAAMVAGLSVDDVRRGTVRALGVVLILRGSTATRPAGGPSMPSPQTGILLLALVAGYLLLARLRRTPLRLGRREIRLSSARIAGAQLLVSSADGILSSGALYVLLAAVTPVP
jgi:uncharacterized membrane protein YbhN (UPF0104 family)